MLMECDECGHRWEINVNDRFRMDIDHAMGNHARCTIYESDKIRIL